MGFVKTSECKVVEKNAKMNYIICIHCGSEYLADLRDCPICCKNKKN